MNLLKKRTLRLCTNFRLCTKQHLKIACALCVSSWLFGCSTVISHSQSGQEQEIHAKRSLGTTLDDNAIVGKIEGKIRALNEQFAAMIQVDSYNKIVLLTGRVPDKGFIDQAVAIAARMPGVRQVHSEVTQGKPTTISNYWYDAWLTTKVKSQLTLTSNAPASKTKVRSFAGYVYLMGVMTPQEAKNAIYVASRVPGAKKVISMIETVDSNERAFVAKPQPQKRTQSTKNPSYDKQTNHTPSTINYVQPIPMDHNNDTQGFIDTQEDIIHNTDIDNEYQTNYQQPASASPHEVKSR